MVLQALSMAERNQFKRRSEMRILAIDPGIRNWGWAILENRNGKISLKKNGSLHIGPSVQILDSLLKDNSPIERIVLEIPSYFGKRASQNLIDLAFISGEIATICAFMSPHSELILIQSSKWLRSIKGGDLALDGVFFKTFNRDPDDPHSRDAALMGVYYLKNSEE